MQNLAVETESCRSFNFHCLQEQREEAHVGASIPQEMMERVLLGFCQN